MILGSCLVVGFVVSVFVKKFIYGIDLLLIACLGMVVAVMFSITQENPEVEVGGVIIMFLALGGWLGRVARWCINFSKADV